MYEKEASGIGAVWIAFVKNQITWGLMSEILSLMVDVAGGTWLQLNGVGKLYVKDKRIMVTWEHISMKQGT